MKNKTTSQGSPGRASSKAPGKPPGKAVKANAQKKATAQRSPLKLRAKTERCISKRTRDKSPKAAPKHGGSTLSSEKAKSPKSPTSPKGKMKNLTQKRSNDVLRGAKSKALAKKKAALKQKDIKKKLKKLTSSNSFLDFWGLTVVGKREASLNASMKVNIMYERNVPLKPAVKAQPKKATTGEEGDKDDKGKDKTPATVPSEESDESKKPKVVKKDGLKLKEKPTPKSKATDPSKEKASTKQSPVKVKSKSVPTKPTETNRKRKSPEYKIFKDEPPAKCRKTNQLKSNSKTKIALKKKKKKKNFPSGHQLSNIIEKSPRQASLIAKAMIAMEQEEESVFESSARTRVFDWTELRSYTQAPTRQIQWKTGLGNAVVKVTDGKPTDTSITAEKEESSVGEIDVSGHPEGGENGETQQSTLLRTLHQVGDTRLLKEYLRAQKEDFQGSVDVEKCPTPEKVKIASPSPKKVTPIPIEEKPQKIASPVKPQSCRVATPIPQFPIGQRTSHMTSYIHHPIPQPVYPQQHPQPIKVTPTYNPPAYIYQYAMDRQQGGLFVPSSPSPLPYSVSSNDISHDFSSTYTLNHMGSQMIGRRAVNPYQANFNPSIHLPVQQVGFNYPPYYPAPIQTLPQSSGPSLQTLHQRYPIVQPQSVIHALQQDMGSYQPSYQTYQQMSGMNQDTTSCMPPPPPPAHSQRPSSIGSSPMGPASIPHQTNISPIESLRSMNPMGIQPIVKSPMLDLMTSDRQNMTSHRQMTHPVYNKPQFYPTNKGTCSPGKYSISINGLNTFIPFKKEREETPEQNCDSVQRNSYNDNSQKQVNPRRRSSEGSDVSDLLHSAHTTMYQIDGMNSSESVRETHQTQASVTCNTTLHNSSPAKISIIGHTSFNASYSVSSILDMPSYKIKPEPELKVCAMNHISPSSRKLIDIPLKENLPVVSFAPVGPEKSQETLEIKKEATISITIPKQDTPIESCTLTQPDKPENPKLKKNEVIVIDDTDESSDDEPLAKLVKSKSSEETEPSAADNPDHQQPTEQKSQPPVTSSQPKPKAKPKPKDEIKIKPAGKKAEKHPPSGTVLPKGQSKEKKQPAVNKSDTNKRAVLKAQEDNSAAPPGVADELAKPDGEGKVKVGCKKLLAVGNPKSKKKVKAEPVFPLTPPRANTNHGWTWVGEGELRTIPKLTMSREEQVRMRKCYKAMQHTSGEVVSVRDCVILQSEGDGAVPYVARVTALWENLNGEMMFSMLWYYQPEHTAHGREPEDGEQELFASKHREENSVACIDDKCFVLMYNEYCRLEAEAVRLEQGVPLPRWRAQIPGISEEDKKFCRPKPPANTCVENIWFCRYDYDVRKKVVRKPKHKKSNLRYRAPCKLV
ncbi:uncharacterized protein LOC131930771 isoform X2 [Physella acuta]|uniref:uncharacterized protein LOC131930771 isoform X2 n=1 Tax=Physella acuta TaxID=109671 RepID=UPI0027DB072D|nr:uncharacterized protein LOC131930771 isoform X2 [Physella acuta]